MNVAIRNLNPRLLHPELDHARHVMRFSQDYDYAEVLTRCAYARSNGDSQDVRDADRIEAAIRACQQDKISDRDPAWTRVTFILLLVASLTIMGALLARHGISSAQHYPTICAKLTADECTAFAQGGW